MVYNFAYKKSFGEKVFDVVVFSIMCIVIVITIYLFLYVLGMSVSKPANIGDGIIWLLPKEFSFESYTRLFSDPQLWVAYGNTLWYVVFGTIINVFMTIIAAYPLAQRRFFLRKQLMLLMIITMYFSGGIIPLYLLINKLGLYNTRWVMIIPNAIAVMYVIIARTFLETNIPDSLYESARIEGANDLTILGKIVIPLSKPIIAVLTLFYAVGQWNSYFTALIYLPSRKLQPLQLYLVNIVIKNQDLALGDMAAGAERSIMMMQIKYSVIIVAMLPIIMVYPFVQKYFVKGVMIGAIKE